MDVRARGASYVYLHLGRSDGHTEVCAECHTQVLVHTAGRSVHVRRNYGRGGFFAPSPRKGKGGESKKNERIQLEEEAVSSYFKHMIPSRPAGLSVCQSDVRA